MSRSAVYALVSAAVGNDVPVYGPFAADSPSDERFVVLTWGNTTPAFKNIGPTLMDVWLYDIDRDYGWITTTHNAVKDALTSAVQVAGDGDVLVRAEWRGEGPDFYDPDYERIGRNATYEVVSR